MIWSRCNVVTFWRSVSFTGWFWRWVRHDFIFSNLIRWLYRLFFRHWWLLIVCSLIWWRLIWRFLLWICSVYHDFILVIRLWFFWLWSIYILFRLRVFWLSFDILARLLIRSYFWLITHCVWCRLWLYIKSVLGGLIILFLFFWVRTFKLFLRCAWFLLTRFNVWCDSSLWLSSFSIDRLGCWCIFDLLTTWAFLLIRAIYCLGFLIIVKQSFHNWTELVLWKLDIRIDWEYIRILRILIDNWLWLRRDSTLICCCLRLRWTVSNRIWRRFLICILILTIACCFTVFRLNDCITFRGRLDTLFRRLRIYSFLISSDCGLDLRWLFGWFLITGWLLSRRFILASFVFFCLLFFSFWLSNAYSFIRRV